MYFDSTMLILIPGLLLALWAQARIRAAYSKYSKVYAQSGIKAADAASAMLRANGNDVVKVQPVNGTLTDHYDPRNETLGLSEGVYQSTSIAALGIAAHEAGHAMQKKEGHAMLGLRNAIVPVVNFGSRLSMPIFVLGLIMALKPLVTVGIAMFSLTVAFTLITLPVEFDASRRAIAMLNAGGFITREEEAGVRKVLNAAALTYVAAALNAILQLARLVLLARGRDRD